MIEVKARELGRLLGQSEEYKALRRANDRLMADAEMRQRLADLEALAEQLERASAQGGEPPKDLIERYDALLSTMQASPVYQGVVAAQANFDKLMVKANGQILEGIKAGATSQIITLG